MYNHEPVYYQFENTDTCPVSCAPSQSLAQPSPSPGASPTTRPSFSRAPTKNPVPAPTQLPTYLPTKQPIPAPTQQPTHFPSTSPIPAPTQVCQYLLNFFRHSCFSYLNHSFLLFCLCSFLQLPMPAPTFLPTAIPTPSPTESCGAGEGFDETNGTCYDCPKGRAVNNSGHVPSDYNNSGWLRCQNCLPGYIAQYSKMASCTKCEEGTFASSERTQCVANCPKGQYERNNSCVDCEGMDTPK